MKMFLVGGVVRDEIMGLSSNDWDFSVEAESFDAMKADLEGQGFKIWLENPEFLTIRARGPKDWDFGGVALGGQTADFVMARKDGAYTDGRRPDEVIAGTLHDDLSRRDFTCNAVAKDIEGNLIDPFGGKQDIANGLIRCVGNAGDRFEEDALRILRAMRFSITKGFHMAESVEAAIRSNTHRLETVSKERQREELTKMFRHDTVRSMKLFARFPAVMDQVFDNGLWLKATLEK